MVVQNGETLEAQVRNRLASARHSIQWISGLIRRQDIAGVLFYETGEISTLCEVGANGHTREFAQSSTDHRPQYSVLGEYEREN